MAAQKPLDYYQNKLSLDLEFPHVFNRSFRPSEEQRLGKNNFHHRCQRLLSFEEVYFKMS